MDKEEFIEKAKKRHEKRKAVAKKVHNHKFLVEFREFINRGSVIDLAVGIIVGSAFTSIVNSLVNDILMPVIGMISGGINFANLKVTIPDIVDKEGYITIAYGNFLQNVVNFLIVAFCIFLLIRFINKLHNQKPKQAVEDAKALKKDDEQIVLLKEIRDELKKKSK